MSGQVLFVEADVRRDGGGMAVGPAIFVPVASQGAADPRDGRARRWTRSGSGARR